MSPTAAAAATTAPTPPSPGPRWLFLLKTLVGSYYTPPFGSAIFGEVPQYSFAANYIEDLYYRGITGSCSASPLLYWTAR